MEMTAAALAVALVSAALMGIAIQRGATCMVAAVDEAVAGRKFGRAVALLEASLWVGGLLGLARLAGWTGAIPSTYSASIWTVAGGALLGLGAWINRACVFGSVARIGNGQWAWLATPLGFFLGCLVPLTMPSGIAASQFENVSLAMAFAFVALIAWHSIAAFNSGNARSYLAHPHRATLLIALTFFATMLTAGAWAYTEALANIARSMGKVDTMGGLRGAMVVALLAGAVLGGWMTGAIRMERPALGDISRCLLGGMLMGLGTGLVPGSNDGLIMLGLPLLLPHAWVALATMVVVIAIAVRISSRQ